MKKVVMQPKTSSMKPTKKVIVMKPKEQPKEQPKKKPGTKYA